MNTAYEPPKTDLRTDQETPADPPLLSPQGRVGRLRYLAHSTWLALAAYVVLGGLAAGLSMVNELLGTIPLLALFGAVIYVNAVFAIKRCHDFNASGWLALLLLVPLAQLVFWFIPGTKGSNQYGPPPTPNTALIVFGGIVFPILLAVGTLAAIAIPAYQDYTQRAQVGEAFSMVSGAKTSIAQHAQDTQQWPGSADLNAMGLGQRVEGTYASFAVEPGTGVINVRMHSDDVVGPSIANGDITFTPEVGDQFRFVCTSDIAQSYLPRSCQGM